MSMKEVAGYIEKQVAYLSGEGLSRFTCYAINLCSDYVLCSEMICALLQLMFPPSIRIVPFNVAWLSVANGMVCVF